MLNTSRITSSRWIAALCIYLASFSLLAADLKEFGCEGKSKLRDSASRAAASLCLPGKSLSLEYHNVSRELSVRVNGQQNKIERVEKGYSPDLIDMQEYVRFLPLELQPYLSGNVVLFNSVVRSTSGNGGGQCGSGYEMYLNALRVEKSGAKVVGKIKIGSCFESIFPIGIDEGPADYSAYSVKDGRLSIKFFNYKKMDGYPTAVVSQDFRQLEFIQ